VGPLQRRAHRQRRRRHLNAGRHPLRPGTDCRHARRPARCDPGGRADRHRGQHPRQRRPLLRQRPGRRRRELGLGRVRRRAGGANPLAVRRLPAGRPRHGRHRRVLLDIFGAFRFDGIELVAPTRTFTGQLDLRVGDRPVRLTEVGPAHTAGDAIVHVPDASVVFTGDIVFCGSHPIVRAGPVTNWIAACDRSSGLMPVSKRVSATKTSAPTWPWTRSPSSPSWPNPAGQTDPSANRDPPPPSEPPATPEVPISVPQRQTTG
jgi:hypothetical protein